VVSQPTKARLSVRHLFGADQIDTYAPPPHTAGSERVIGFAKN
jgi:hypothetical protein